MNLAEGRGSSASSLGRLGNLGGGEMTRPPAPGISRNRPVLHGSLSAEPGEVVLLRADVSSRLGLGRLVTASISWPLSHVACLLPDTSLAPEYHATMAISPGWLTFLQHEGDLATLQSRPLLERPGLGVHHLGGRWPVSHADASLAMAQLLQAPGIGPSLTSVARHLGWNATALGRTVLREVGLSYPSLRLRRAMLLLAGQIACESKSFTAAAAALGWDRIAAARAFSSRGFDWRRFKGTTGRARIVPELQQVLIARANASNRDRSVAEGA